MTISVKKLAIHEHERTSANTGPLITENYLGLVGDVEVACFVRLGTLTMTINELRQLKQGARLSLSQKVHEPIDIVLNNQVIARGELMSVDDCFAIQITEVNA